MKKHTHSAKSYSIKIELSVMEGAYNPKMRASLDITVPSGADPAETVANEIAPFLDTEFSKHEFNYEVN